MNAKSFFYRAIAALIITLIALVALPAKPAFAATCTFTSVGATPNWGTNTSWTITGAGCPASGTTFPGNTSGNTDNVVIAAGSAVSLNVSPTQTIGTIIFNAGATANSLTFSGSQALTSGAITMNGTTATNGAQPTLLNVGAGTLSATSIALTPINANLGSNNRRVQVTISTGTVNVTGNITTPNVTTNTGTGVLFTGNGSLNIGGTFLTDAEALFTPSTGTINYNGAAQTVKVAAYNNLILSGSGAKTMSAGTSVTGNLSISPTGSATASIAAGQNLTVGNLTLGGLGRINGTWGSGPGTPPTNKNTTYFSTTTGYLTVGTDTRTAASVTTWPTASGITSGQALTSSTLSGGAASTAGSFAFTTPATIPPVGTYSASVTFSPTDATSYTQAIGSVNVTVSPAATGTIYYVNNTNGSCSDAGTGLTIAQPFCTIGRGVTAALAGDTVHVLAGTYAETITMIRSGSVGSPITFSADPGVTVTGAASYGFRVASRSYITIDGFTITDTTERGVYVSGSDSIIVSNNHISLAGTPVSGSTQPGIHFDTTTNSTISGNITDHNSSYGIYVSGGSGNTISDNISFANAREYQRVATGINIFTSNNNTIIHNITYANEDSGIQVYTGSTGNLVVGNLSYGNADHGIDLLNSPNNTIIGNTVQGNYTSGINAEGTSTGVTILNNIAVDNGIAIVGSGQPGNIRVDANSTAGSTSNYNIVFLSGAGTSQIQWNGTNYATLAAFKTANPAQEVNGLQADPLFVAPAVPAVRPNAGNGGLPAVNVGDYHIASTSPAIDSANSNATGEPLLDIEGNPRVDTPIANTGFGVRTYDDRGAYESQTGTGGTTPTITTEAVSAIGSTTATGNGTITDLGTPNPYQHGIVWDTAANPTIALATKTTEGAATSTGSFTSNITGLTPGTLYHVRAYATNTTNTAYGTDVTFAVTSISVGTSGTPSVYGSPVTFTATVLPATATGTVTFYDGATMLGTGTLSAGVATFSTNTLSVSGSPHSITASYAGSGIYGPSTSSTISQNVTPATLTYTADAVSRSYGIANPTFTGTVTGFIAPDTQASATTGALVFTTTATSASDVGSYAITGSGLTAVNNNYIFTQAAGNATALTITPATPTASITNSPVTYNGSAQTAVVSCLGGGTATLVTGTGSGTNAGSYPTSVDCAASLNYAAATGLSAGNFVISPATPTASITNSPVTYNGSAHTAAVACSGGGTATLASGGTGTNAGTYPAIVDCAASLNYVASAGLAAGNFVIDPATPTASITNSPVTYNGSAQTAVVSCLGGGTATLVSGTGSGTNAGSYPASVDCAASLNYAAAIGLSAGNFVIDPATPTAFVTNSPVTYNGSAQTATVSCLGGGTATLVSGTGTGTNAGSYPATVDCAASLNYVATAGLAAGDFVIDPATPTASITNSPVTYNGSVQTATVSCLGGGTATLLSGTGTGTAVGSYPASVDCAASANYIAATGLSAGNFVISPATPTAFITNSPVIYNGSAQTATVSCLGGGAATLASGGTGTNAGSYPAIVDCAASANYDAAVGLSAGDFIINPATPTASITNSPVTYNGSAQTATVSCLGGGTATLVSGTGSGTNAGSYPASVDCAASLNYAAATGLSAGSFVIDPATPTASITNSPVTYNGSAQTATVACSGGGTATLASGGTGTNAGSYPATVDCAASLNYVAAAGLAAGNFVIDPATPIASITNSPVTYNGSVQTATVSCLGGGTATLVSGTGTGTAVGSYPASVDCAASANYIAATGLSAGNFVISNSTQSITVTTSAPATASNGSTFSVTATADSGLTVSITVSGVCTVVDNGNGTADITMTSGTGTCSVFYDQAGDSNYSAAPQIQEDVTATEGPSFTSANNTTFDVTFLGTFTITAVGTPQNMTISLAGSLPSGVTFTDNGDGTANLSGIPALGTNGTYPLSLTANNGVAPNGTQNFTLTIKSGPVISANGINSNPDTGNGNVGENESILDTLGLTQLTVEFSQDVYNPAGDTDQDDVTNPANYVLVRSTTASFATVSCADGAKAPDVQISVDSVSYSNGGGAGPFVSTLSINGGFPLNVVGFYRLYVCGTTSIVDANNTGLVLAGNGTTPGTDFQRNFRIVTQVSGGGGGGGGASSTSSTLVTSGFLIPVTGFAPNQVTTLPAQPADKTYTSMGQMTIDIPTLGVKFPIVGASINNKTWDLTWLNSVAYLEGSAYPTTAGNTVLTAHVQDASNNIGPFSDIKGMTIGQNIYIHVNGQTYVYQVQESRKVSPTNVTTIFKHEEDSWITLVTCEDFNAKTGVYASRRMVRAVLISVIPTKK